MGKHIVTSKTHGRFTVIVDRQDDWIFEEYTVGINKLGSLFYAKVNLGKRGEQVLLHIFIMESPNVDHKNRNTLDCRRSNLRLATKAQNNKNASIRKDNTTGIKGVYLRPNGKYRAMIAVSSKLVHIGYFDTIEEAAAARREAAQKYFGEFANKEHP
jgi:hypothetical protein